MLPLQLAPQVQTLTLEELETRMNQVQLHAELDGAEAAYVSGKIPYAYDYGAGEAGAEAVRTLPAMAPMWLVR